MEIEDNLLSISNALFKNRDNWKYVTEQQKEKWFFIFNRYFSKKYPNRSQLLNDKYQDKVLGMDLWFHFMKSEPYPKWFWSKSEKEKDKSELSDKEIKELLLNLQITRSELDLLIKWYPDLIKEELKYYKDVSKSNK
jgi:hypothetical protein